MIRMTTQQKQNLTMVNMNKPSNKQKGAVLIVSLVMLTLLTIIGVASMSRSSLELKVASNAQQHNVAFQAAQSRLAFATSNDPSNPINFLIPIDFTEPPSVWPVQTCNPPDCPDNIADGDWAATATVEPLDCGPTAGSSLEEGKSLNHRYFAVTATGRMVIPGVAEDDSPRSIQVSAIRYPAKNC